MGTPLNIGGEGTTLRLTRTRKLLLIFAAMVAMVGVVKCGSAPIYKRYKRSPQFGLGSLLGGLTSCGANCNQGKYKFGRALAISGAGLGALGLATNNEAFQRVGGTALVGGLGIKGAAKLFGRR